MAQTNQLNQKTGVKAFYNHLQVMEVLCPHIYPKGAAQQYLRLVCSSSPPSSPAAINDYILSCLSPKSRLIFEQLLERITLAYGKPAPVIFASSLKRLRIKRQLRRERKVKHRFEVVEG